MTTDDFGAKLLTVPEIFKEKYFTIPDYQRSYSWEKKQVEELLKDIEHLLDDSSALRHYTGTLVLSRPNSNCKEEFHVVDGQQRLTTLVIIIRILSDLLPEEVRAELRNLYLIRGDLGNERAVLHLNSDTHKYFENAILAKVRALHEPTKLEAHDRIQESHKLVEKWLSEFAQKGVDASAIRCAIETKLGFLVYAPKEDAETGVMFEVINNRGKDLSELEKVKNFLIYCSAKLAAQTLRAEIDSNWSDILKNLNTAKKTSLADEGAFLRYCVAVHFKLNKSDSQYGYSELKKLLDIDSAIKEKSTRNKIIGEIKEFITFLNAAALWYSRLYGQQHKGLSKSISAVLNLLRAQGQHASIMPILLALVIKGCRDEKRLVELLKLLEILNFRVYMARRMTARNDTGQGNLYKFASLYYCGKLHHEYKDEVEGSVETEEDMLEYCLVEFVLRNAADDPFRSSFILEKDSPDDFYQWGGLRYFLMNYEASLQPNKTIQIDKILLSRSEGKSSDYLSVEHIWATGNRNLDGENNRAIDKFQKRRFGNFVLLELRLNIQGSDENLELKLPKYLGLLNKEPSTDLEHVKVMAKFAIKLLKRFKNEARTKNYYLGLYENLISYQENLYMEFAEIRWSVRTSSFYKQVAENLSNDE